MRWASLVLVAGALSWAAWHGPVARALAWGLFSVVLWLAAQAVRRFSQAVPDGQGNWVAAADAPAAFRRRRRAALWGLYASSTVSAAIAVLPLLAD